ncbi:MAG TPA: hypothetical protein VGZ22_25340 [Isosphaeraceae bacterium]|jgi:hypothetical protein|nr:hypothetical protein [Isosphaeraceae bacterium]
MSEASSTTRHSASAAVPSLASVPPRPGARTFAALVAFYLVAIAIATYPAVTTLGSRLPNLGDPLTHLWTMKWYKACLVEGKSAFRSPDIQYPVGAPLGLFPPMQLQTLVYIPLSSIFQNDILCYNLIWLFGLLYTGLGSFVLAWYLLRDRACAAFAGLLVMLSTPVMLHAHGHLELIHVGGVPLFLVAWMRLVDRPGWGRMLAASALYALVAMSAHYYVVMTVIPAALYVLAHAVRSRGNGIGAWMRARAGWLLGFSALSGLLLVALFAVPLWTIAQGQSMARPRSQFVIFHAPLWGYVVPTCLHAASQILPFDPFKHTNYHLFIVECGSYFGVVTLVLLQYAAVNRVRFARAAFWWVALGLMIVLSLGAVCQIGVTKYELPAYWLWKVFPPFRLLRVPARFNLFASLCAAMIAAAGLKHLLGRLPRRSVQVALYAALCAVAVGDLSMVPFKTEPLPALPGCYAWIKEHSARAAILELPLLASSSDNPLNSLCGYWQSIHGLRTTAGYSAHSNALYDTQVVHNSPFDAYAILKPNYLLDPGNASFGVASHVQFQDYVWLYLTVNHLDYVVVHHETQFSPEQWQHLDRLEALLQATKVYEDKTTSVYDRTKLKPPSQPTVLHAAGWRSAGWPEHLAYTLGKVGSVVVYNPDPERPLQFALEVAAFRKPRTVRLCAGEQELARWQVAPDDPRTYVSPPFRLPNGIQELTIVSDGEESPSRRREAAAEGDMRPFSLRVASISLRNDSARANDAREVAARPRPAH